MHRDNDDDDDDYHHDYNYDVNYDHDHEDYLRISPQVPRKRYSMPMSAYVIPYGSPNDAMMTRIQERRHFDYDAYPTTGRYGYERGYIEEVPYYDRERYYSRAPNYHREPLKKQYYQERFYNNENQLSSIPNVPRQPDRTERNLFPGHTNDAFLY